jgi:hypothetical protein
VERGDGGSIESSEIDINNMLEYVSSHTQKRVLEQVMDSRELNFLVYKADKI